MKVDLKKEDLLSMLTAALRAVPGRTTIPILNCVLVTAGENRVTIAGSNTELYIRKETACEVEESGSAAIDAKLLVDIVRKLPDEDVRFEVTDSLATIISGAAVFTLPVYPPSEFPEMPDVEHMNEVRLSQFALREAIRQTLFSSSPNELNLMMSGEHFEVNGDRLRVTALDGHRIAIRNVTLDYDCGFADAIIPGKTLGEIVKILAQDTEKEVCIVIGPSNVRFEFNGTLVVSCLLNGPYFNVDPMLDPDYSTKVVVDRQSIIDMVDRSILLITDTDRKPVIFRLDGQSIETTMNSGIGQLKESLEVEKTGDDLTIGFNPRLLLDMMKAIDEDTVTMYFTNAKAPCIVRDNEGTYLYLVLPVNLKNITA